MRRAAVLLVVLSAVVGTSLGISMFLPPTTGGTGSMELAVGEVDSGDATFDDLTVTFSTARVYAPVGGWTEIPLDGAQVDLLVLNGSGTATIANLTLPEGDYTKVEFTVANITAQVGGEDVQVIVPSGKLKLVGKFSVFADGSAGYDFDIRVVKRGNKDIYNLLPVIGKRSAPDDGKGNGGGEGGSDGHGKGGAEKGQLRMAIGKSRADVDAFDHLNVTFYKARVYQAVNNSTEANWTEMELDNVTVDLTNLTSTNQTIVANLSLDAGNYTKVELFVSEVVGIVDGEPVDVFVPSGKLKIVGSFEVEANETLEFTFDIHVVQRGHQAVYNLLPVIAKNQGDEDDDD